MAVSLVKNNLPAITVSANLVPGSFTGYYAGHRTQRALLEQASVNFSKELTTAKEANSKKRNYEISKPFASTFPPFSDLLEEVGVHGIRWAGLQGVLGYIKKW